MKWTKRRKKPSKSKLSQLLGSIEMERAEEANDNAWAEYSFMFSSHFAPKFSLNPRITHVLSMHWRGNNNKRRKLAHSYFNLIERKNNVCNFCHRNVQLFCISIQFGVEFLEITCYCIPKRFAFFKQWMESAEAWWEILLLYHNKKGKKWKDHTLFSRNLLEISQRL